MTKVTVPAGEGSQTDYIESRTEVNKAAEAPPSTQSKNEDKADVKTPQTPIHKK